MYDYLLSVSGELISDDPYSYTWMRHQGLTYTSLQCKGLFRNDDWLGRIMHARAREREREREREYDDDDDG